MIWKANLRPESSMGRNSQRPYGAYALLACIAAICCVNEEERKAASSSDSPHADSKVIDSTPHVSRANDSDSTKATSAGVPTASTSIASLIDAADDSVLTRTADWKYRQSNRVDLNGDGTLETVVLTCDVRMDARGRPLWEDGHRWAVYLEGTPRNIYLYSRFLPNGRLSVSVAKPIGAATTLVLLEQTPFRIALYEIAVDASSLPFIRARLERDLDPSKAIKETPRH
jgi:hypothetical protein